MLNGWWESHELEHALRLAEPKLVIADAPARQADRGDLRRLRGAVRSQIEQPVEQALAELLDGRTAAALPEIAPEDDATILFTSGSTGEAKGALSTHRAVTTATYAYADRADDLARHADRGGPGAGQSSRARCSACPCSMSPAKSR